jgi:hypothetical protein
MWQVKHLKGLTLVSAPRDGLANREDTVGLVPGRLTSEYVPFQMLVSGERLTAVRAEHHFVGSRLERTVVRTV